MRISTMRALDARLGRLLCRAFTLARHLLPERGAVGPPERVLLIKFWGMGSLVCATPLAQALRERHPGLRLDLLTFDFQRQTAAFLGIADQVITLSPRSLAGFLRSTLAVLARIRRTRYSAVIDLEFFSKFTALLAYLSGAPMRIGFQFRPIDRGDLFTHAVPFNDRLHVTRIFRSLGAPLGVPDAPAAYPRLEPAADDVASARRLLGAAGECPAYVVLNANVSEQSAHLRRWPLDRYAELAGILAHEEGCGIVLIGGPADREYVAELAARIGPLPGLTDLSGRLTVGELAAVLRGAAAVVTSDTGPMHMAVAVGAPVIAFFGTETPALYGPIGEGHAVIRRDLACSPCLTVYNEKLFTCPYGNACMQNIETAEVLSAVRARLGVAGAPRAGLRTIA
ncbi:MAG: glycosyltransferase family 9 protein [Candidatus Eisenbacteria bacterium]